MKRDDWMLFTLTFLTGFAIGMYVYIAAFKPIYVPEKLSETEAGASDWSLVVKQRNVSQDPSYIQPSFRLLGDGQYVFLPGGQASDALLPREGKLSSSLMRDLRRFDGGLKTYSEPAVNQNCLSVNEYEYRFTVETNAYVLDSCRTKLQDDTVFLKILNEAWDEITGNGTSRQADTFSGWAQGWLRERIGVTE